MSQAKKKMRQYNAEYIKYGFIENSVNPCMPLCLLCSKTFSNEAMKPSRLEDHLNRMHPDKKDKNVDYFRNLEKMYIAQPSVSKLFSVAAKQDDDGLRASYNISRLIAQTGKPHTIGESIILPAVKEVITTVLHKPAADIIRKIPLSNSSVQRRIDEMAENIEELLCNHLKSCKFSLQLDESTLPNNEALLLTYVRFIKDEEVCQELLFVRNLETDTKGETIFKTLEKFFDEKDIPLKNIISVATDGAPAMRGCQKGFIAYLKNKIPNVLAVHCVIHRQHLVAKNLSERLHQTLQHVIRAINKIRHNSLNERLFNQLCTANDEEFNRLLFHTEVRWLSKGNCLTRFYNLFDSVVEFLENKDTQLCKDLISSKNDIAYLTDLYALLNNMNLQLQGDGLNLIKTKNIIAAFIAKLLLHKKNIGRREFHNFPNLSVSCNEDLLVYCQHLENLHENFIERFQDILNLEIPGWVLDPFSNANVEASAQLEEELIELTTNEELKIKFKDGYQQFWLQKSIQHLYPGLWLVVQKFLLAFPSSYLCERGFSTVTMLLTKNRNQLQITKRGDLRLFLSAMEPDIDKLVKNHQIHPSH
ncbi:SCAN domain-containing protein 3-like [Ctenocephalides felis]|uniref:SCAN domain-containing protein 3-like n=1 Tax=Ctenocephalides felis TaxID=7515 RepID=UPI000E6E3DB2|nr:SCAN domain-containing protein 3-like [Ctenocephalides felis]